MALCAMFGLSRAWSSNAAFPSLPPPWSVEEPVFHRARRQRPGARLCLFRGRDRPAARPNTPLRISVFFDTCRGRGPSLTPRPPMSVLEIGGSVMSRTQRKYRSKALPVLGAAGLSLSLATSASAAIGMHPDTVSQQVMLYEEEIADISLATFHVFDKERAGIHKPQARLAMGVGGCGCGCAGSAAPVGSACTTIIHHRCLANPSSATASADTPSAQTQISPRHSLVTGPTCVAFYGCCPSRFVETSTSQLQWRDR